MPALNLRPALPQDRDFLRQVYGSTRAEELARTGWDEAQCAAFVAMQFDAQALHYREHFPHAEDGVIEVVVDGRPLAVGRMWVDRREASVHVLDIAVLPDHRGRGLGTECLRRLMSEAAARGVPLTIKVERFNPAHAWYERLGFAPVSEHGTHIEMAWQAGIDVPTEETEGEQA